MNSLDLVREFHARFKQPVNAKPTLDNEAVNVLRIKLIAEELQELAESLGVKLDYSIDEGWHKPDPVECLDALTDLQYVLDGSYLSLGFAHLKDAALQEVHRSNMSKLGADGEPVYLPNGKVTKGPAYSPPNLLQLLEVES
jgi:predicted HAD superfamily Cof-like phosphohydrolase